MSDREIAKMEKLLKALANRRRLAILKFLKEKKEASVGEIAHQIKLSFKATSKHLYILSVADLVEKEQMGLQVFYRLSKEKKPLIDFLLFSNSSE